MAELWDNIIASAGQIKDFILSFYDTAKFVIELIPTPFRQILLVALAITVVIASLKIVRG